MHWQQQTIILGKTQNHKSGQTIPKTFTSLGEILRAAFPQCVSFRQEQTHTRSKYPFKWHFNSAATRFCCSVQNGNKCISFRFTIFCFHLLPCQFPDNPPYLFTGAPSALGKYLTATASLLLV